MQHVIFFELREKKVSACSSKQLLIPYLPVSTKIITVGVSRLTVDRDYTAVDRISRQKELACTVIDRLGQQHR